MEQNSETEKLDFIKEVRLIVDGAHAQPEPDFVKLMRVLMQLEVLLSFFEEEDK